MLIPETFAPLAKRMKGDLVVFVQNPERNGSPLYCDIWICDSLDPQGMWKVANQCLTPCDPCGTHGPIKQEDGSYIILGEPDNDVALYFTPLRLVQVDGSEEQDDNTEDYDDIPASKMRQIDKNVGPASSALSGFTQIAFELFELVGARAGYALLEEEIAKMAEGQNESLQQSLYHMMLQVFMKSLSNAPKEDSPTASPDPRPTLDKLH